MKKIQYFLLLALLLWVAPRAFAQSAIVDSVDVLRYDINIDYDNPSNNYRYESVTRITFVCNSPCSDITFDLICDSVKYVTLDNQPLIPDYDRSNVALRVAMSPASVADTHTLEVGFCSRGYVESYNWGGLHISQNMCYNLGVAFQEYPHNFGRAWFPCRDNFHDKATYSIAITSPASYQHQCSGVLTQQSTTGNLRSTTWELDIPTSTYLVSISMAPFHLIERKYTGIYGTYPATLGFLNHDSTHVYEAYDILEDVIPMFERCLGPYRWHRIGYISTEKGSMEHANNIALVSSCMDKPSSNSCQMTICHELAHAWFGNLVTCATAEDMWFNEGGATFCEELATEAAFGKEAANDYYQDKLSKVIRTAHIDDGGYRTLSGMPQHITYGTTTYQQGAMMWHSLRGYLGDSLFYASMQRLFSSCAFGNVSAQDVRDSLSLYSGIDLTGFFDAHVFNTGFIDYSVDRLDIDGYHATLTLRQLLRGRTTYATANRVPVTFFSADGEKCDQLMTFDDSVATASFYLPFTPAYCVVDYHHALSDAVTADTTTLRAKGLRSLDHSYCKINVSQANTDTRATVHVAHHYAHPTGDTLSGVTRLANRYWEVSGFVPWGGDVTGRFLYNQGANGSSGASSLDQGFYDRTATLDSLCLLYRRDATQPWQLVSTTRTNSSTSATGYFTARLFPGQYALAVADTSLLAISQPEVAMPFRLFPNPGKGQFSVDLGSYDQHFDLTVVDTMGRTVLRKRGLRSMSQVSHHLPAGTYVVLVYNKTLSLKSQLIIK